MSSITHACLPSWWQSELKELGFCWELSSSLSKPPTDSARKSKIVRVQDINGQEIVSGTILKGQLKNIQASKHEYISLSRV